MKFKDDFLHDNKSGDNKFVSLKDKESITGIFAGEPQEFFIVWDQGKAKEVSPDSPGAKMRFRINFIVKNGAAYEVKVLENSGTVYKQLAELHKEYDLSTIVVKITRNGTGLETTYNIFPLIKQQITPEVAAHLKTLELHQFGVKPNKQAQHIDAAFDSQQEIPF